MKRPASSTSAATGIALAVAASLYAAGRGYLLFHVPYNLDELDHSHMAWLTAHGWRYLHDDFDISRTPLLRYFMAPLFRVLGEASLVPYRAAFCVVSYAAAALLYAVSRKSANSHAAAVLTTAAFLLSAPFVFAAQQIRYEAPVLLFFVLGFYCFYRASAQGWHALWTFAAGFFTGLAVTLKVLVAPYLLAFWVVFLWDRRRAPLRENALPLATLALGTGVPFLALLLQYAPLARPLAMEMARAGGPVEMVLSMVRTATAGSRDFTVGPYFRGQALFWATGAVAAVVSLRRLWVRPSTVVRVHLLATAIYLVTIPALKRQMFLQDLVLPAVSAALFMGHAAVFLPPRRGPVLRALLLILLAIESATFATRTVIGQDRDDAAIRTATGTARARLAASGPTRLSAAWDDLGRAVSPSFYDYGLTRAQQDAGIRFFNRTVAPTETAVAADGLSVFRRRSISWVTPVLVAHRFRFERFREWGRAFPSFSRYVLCATGDVHVGDPFTSGVEENLIRDLDRYRHRAILLDRFFLDLLTTYPRYRDVVERNYRAELDVASTLAFAVRRDGDWSAPPLPPHPPLRCTEFAR